MSSFLPGVPIPDVIVSMINLEKWEEREEGKKLRTSLFCELYLEFLYLIGIIFFFFKCRIPLNVVKKTERKP